MQSFDSDVASPATVERQLQRFRRRESTPAGVSFEGAAAARPENSVGQQWVETAISRGGEAVVGMANVPRGSAVAAVPRMPTFGLAPVKASNNSLTAVSVTRPSGSDRRLTLRNGR